MYHHSHTHNTHKHTHAPTHTQHTHTQTHTHTHAQIQSSITLPIDPVQHGVRGARGPIYGGGLDSQQAHAMRTSSGRMKISAMFVIPL